MVSILNHLFSEAETILRTSQSGFIIVGKTVDSSPTAFVQSLNEAFKEGIEAKDSGHPWAEGKLGNSQPFLYLRAGFLLFPMIR